MENTPAPRRTPGSNHVMHVDQAHRELTVRPWRLALDALGLIFFTYLLFAGPAYDGWWSVFVGVACAWFALDCAVPLVRYVAARVIVARNE